jgi:hypothetical protein
MIILLSFGFFHPWTVALGTLFLREYAAREVKLKTIHMRDVQYSAIVPLCPPSMCILFNCGGG